MFFSKISGLHVFVTGQELNQVLLPQDALNGKRIQISRIKAFNSSYVPAALVRGVLPGSLECSPSLRGYTVCERVGSGWLRSSHLSYYRIRVL